MRARPATAADAAVIAAIYYEGIEDRLSTFETEPRVASDVEGWLDEGLPLVVVEDAQGVAAWAVGRAVLEALIHECESRGYWKLLSRIFPENEASLALCRSLGFREQGGVPSTNDLERTVSRAAVPVDREVVIERRRSR